MEVNQLHASAALPAVYIEKEAGWASKPVSTFRREEKDEITITDCKIWFYIHEWPEDNHVIGRNM
jgi:hypothetical protein